MEGPKRIALFEAGDAFFPKVHHFLYPCWILGVYVDLFFVRQEFNITDMNEHQVQSVKQTSLYFWKHIVNIFYVISFHSLYKKCPTKQPQQSIERSLGADPKRSTKKFKNFSTLQVAPEYQALLGELSCQQKAGEFLEVWEVLEIAAAAGYMVGCRVGFMILFPGFFCLGGRCIKWGPIFLLCDQDLPVVVRKGMPWEFRAKTSGLLGRLLLWESVDSGLRIIVCVVPPPTAPKIIWYKVLQKLL